MCTPVLQTFQEGVKEYANVLYSFSSLKNECQLLKELQIEISSLKLQQDRECEYAVFLEYCAQ